MLDLIIKGGRVVTPDGAGEYDVAIQGERIAAVAIPGALTEPAKRVIDAGGKVVVPGGIEPHAHISWVPMTLAKDPNIDYSQISQGPSGASRACAFGGTTTIVDFTTDASPTVDLLTAVANKHSAWKEDSYIDYSFHCVVPGDSPVEYLEQIPEVIRGGTTTIKCFTRARVRVEDGFLYDIMSVAARHGGITAIHAENQAIVQHNREKLQREGRIGVENLHLAHSNLSEDIEFRKVIRMAECAGAALYLVHVSAKEGVAAVAEARSRGVPIYGETLHCYTGFTCENYKEPDGSKYQTYPSLKYPEDRDALWAGLVDGRLCTIATDEIATTYAFKVSGKTIFDAIGGHNGVEVRMPYTFSEGVAKGTMSLERFVDVTSANAAKILGMYPKKGAIAPGSDADIAIIDPSVRKKLKVSDLHAESDYSIWEGWNFQGWPVTTVLRGKVVVEDGKLVGSKEGKFVARKTAPDVLATPVC